MTGASLPAIVLGGAGVLASLLSSTGLSANLLDLEEKGSLTMMTTTMTKTTIDLPVCHVASYLAAAASA